MTTLEAKPQMTREEASQVLLTMLAAEVTSAEFHGPDSKITKYRLKKKEALTLALSALQAEGLFAPTGASGNADGWIREVQQMRNTSFFADGVDVRLHECKVVQARDAYVVGYHDACDEMLLSAAPQPTTEVSSTDVAGESGAIPTREGE
jgi:hypothetical protein